MCKNFVGTLIVLWVPTCHIASSNFLGIAVKNVEGPRDAMDSWNYPSLLQVSFLAGIGFFLLNV